MSDAPVILLPDAGPLITLAYAGSLDLLLVPGWSVQMVDMVLHEVTRNETPTSQAIARWVSEHRIPERETKVFASYQDSLSKGGIPRKRDLGELAAQEVMTELALASPAQAGVFLFEDHKIARVSFLVPKNCHKISTRAFLMFLEQRGLLDSAVAIERRAIHAGRAFSSMRFPPD